MAYSLQSREIISLLLDSCVLVLTSGACTTLRPDQRKHVF
jgi:hypothetical protein